MSSARWRNWLWVLLGAVLVVALVVGTVTRHASGPQTPTTKAAALDRELRCPSCDDESVAESSAASAAAIRQYVLASVEHGVSDSSIVSDLETRYPGILLRPPASGVQGLVWFLPIGGFAVATCVVAAFFWRRHTRREVLAPGEDDRRLVAAAMRGASARPPGTAASAQ